VKKMISLAFVLAFSFCAFGLWAADLSIDMQVNTSAKDPTNNYLTFKGRPVAVVKDQVDATTSASKQESTAMFNVYRWDIFGGKLLPGALRNFLLYSVADDAIRVGDGLTVTKAANGVIQVRYVHRGSAFQFSTDASGKLTLPTAVKTRVIGFSDNTIGTDFSPTGKVADVDWKKVWDSSIPDGKQVGATAAKTGKIMDDVADSHVYIWGGVLQFTFDGKILKVIGDLSAKKP
jgi:hypothetical protein